MICGLLSSSFLDFFGASLPYGWKESFSRKLWRDKEFSISLLFFLL
jgi:hypothetical protein